MKTLHYSFITTLCLLLIMGKGLHAQGRGLFQKKQKLKQEERWSYEVIDGSPSTQGKVVATTEYDESGAVKLLKLYQKNGIEKTNFQYKKLPKHHKRQRFQIFGHKEILDMEEELDASGNIIKRIRYKANQEILDLTTWTYDQKGRPLEEVYYDEKHQKVYEIKTTYNDAQRSSIEHSFYSNSGASYQTAVALDEDFQVLSRIRYNEHGALLNKIIYQRSKNGQLKAIEHYPDGQTMSIKELFSYQDKNNKVDHKIYNAKTNELLEYTVFVYKYH